jgi:hypothetical protein
VRVSFAAGVLALRDVPRGSFPTGLASEARHKPRHTTFVIERDHVPTTRRSAGISNRAGFSENVLASHAINHMGIVDTALDRPRRR